MKPSRKDLSGRSLLKQIRKQFNLIPDPRRQASVQIPLADALMSGLAVFNLKFPSLLQFEQRLRQQAEKNLGTPSKRSSGLSPIQCGPNLRSLHGIRQIPSDTQMREILDPIDPEALRPAFAAHASPAAIDNCRP